MGNVRKLFTVNAVVLSLIAGLAPTVALHDDKPPAKPAPKHDCCSPATPAAKGEVVAELDKAIFYIFQAQDGTYWFGSDGQGVYRYKGKAITHFTTKDGLVSNHIRGIQEDKSGNIYFTTYAGISKFDGHTFTTLGVSKDSAVTDWKLRPEDMWFVGPQDAGVAYRYDGKLLHRLALPKTREGDEIIARYPRDKYPNAKFSPYDVYSIFKDSKGNVWVCTALLGACRYDGKSFTWIPETELRNGSFGTRSIIEDKDGRFWFCDPRHRYEVDLSNPAEPKFKAVAGLGDAKDPNKLPFEGIMSSIVDSTGALWMATYGQGVWRYDGKNLTHYPVKDGGKDITLFTISKDHQGVLWLGTHAAGAYKFNGRTFEKWRP